MDTSQLKDVVKKLGFLKDFSSLIVPVIIFAVAVLVFVFSLLMGSKHKEDVEKQSVSLGRDVKSQLRSAVSKDQGGVEEQYQLAYERDANQIAVLAKQSNQRELLSYEIFPKPKDTSMFIYEDFGRRFRGGLEQLVSGMNGRDCPSDAEFERALGKSAKTSRYGRNRRSSFGRGGVDDTIKDALCQERAELASVYINLSDLTGYDFWNKYEYVNVDKSIEDCWYSQLSYWIIEDVLDAVAKVNSGSSSVFDSPVKRILGVRFSTDEFGSSRGRKKKTTKVIWPRYVLSEEEQLVYPVTGRKSDKELDIVHFNAVLLVSNKGFLSFMKELCSAREHEFRGYSGDGAVERLKHNQITILASNIWPIDRKDIEHELYRYGEDAVVKVDLVCEYIFNREGYDQIKPELIKKQLRGESSGKDKRGRGRR